MPEKEQELLEKLHACTFCPLRTEGNRGPTQWSGPLDSCLLYTSPSPRDTR